MSTLLVPGGIGCWVPRFPKIKALGSSVNREATRLLLGVNFLASSPIGKNSIARDEVRRREKHVGRKSSGQEKDEGAMDKAKGRMKEAAGSLSGDKDKKSEGRSGQRKGNVKDKKGKAKDLLK